MKRTLTAAAVAMAAVSAHAYLDVQFDNRNQVVNRPATGTVELTFSGTVDVEFGYDVTATNLEFPGLTTAGPFLTAAFDVAFVAYGSAVSPDVDYAGAIITVTVASSDALGLYNKNSGSLGFSPDAEIVVFATNVDTIADNEFYSVNVVPEPTSLAVLGIGAAALLRRKRR